MNVNEVIAHLASAASGLTVHPNDHVNASQSSNDVFPTAHPPRGRTAAARRSSIPDLQGLEDAFSSAAREWTDVVKPGRTHLMDAAPVTLGQEFDGFAGQVRQAIRRIESAVPRLLEVPLGGTAVGTGLNAPPTFAELTLAADRASAPGSPSRGRTRRWRRSPSRDALVEMSGVLRGLALSLVKICNDLRWMASGPHAGLAEITLPAIQPGSSIMPGKVNPVVPEAVIQACCQVVGLDAAVTMGATTSNVRAEHGDAAHRVQRHRAVQLLTRQHRGAAPHLVPGITVGRRPAASLGGVVTGDRHLAEPARRLRHGRGRRQGCCRSRRDDPRGGAAPGRRRAASPPSSSTRRSTSTASRAAVVDELVRARTATRSPGKVMSTSVSSPSAATASANTCGGFSIRWNFRRCSPATANVPQWIGTAYRGCSRATASAARPG